MNIPQIVRSWLIVIVAITAAWWLISKVADWLAGVSDNVAAAVITGLVGLSGILFAQWYSKSKEIADSHRPAKIEVYTIFFDLVERFMNQEKRGEVLLDDEKIPRELEEQFQKMFRGMIVWASPEVIAAWNEFRITSASENESALILLVVDDVLQAIRKDLGNSNFGLKRGNLIKMYLSDPSDIDRLRDGPNT